MGSWLRKSHAHECMYVEIKEKKRKEEGVAYFLELHLKWDLKTWGYLISAEIVFQIQGGETKGIKANVSKEVNGKKNGIWKFIKDPFTQGYVGQ